MTRWRVAARDHSFSAIKNGLVAALTQLRGKWWDKLEIEAGACKYAGSHSDPSAGKQSLKSELSHNQENSRTVPPQSVPQNDDWTSEMAVVPQGYISVWNQIDRVLVNLKLQEPLNRHIEETDKERRSIEQNNRDNRHAFVRATLQMVERRADEWIAFAYAVYCEVWELQGQSKSADFLRTLRDNIIEPKTRGRTTAETYHFASLWKNCGYPGLEVLHAQLNGFRRAMQKLEHRWKMRLEIEAKEWEHKTWRKSAPGHSPTTKINDGEGLGQPNRSAGSAPRSKKRRRKLRAKSAAEKIREARICAAIAQGNKGLEYCIDVKTQRVVTRATWRSDGCPKEYPDAYTHANPRWRELIQKEKNRYASKMKKT